MNKIHEIEFFFICLCINFKWLCSCKVELKQGKEKEENVCFHRRVCSVSFLFSPIRCMRNIIFFMFKSSMKMKFQFKNAVLSHPHVQNLKSCFFFLSYSMFWMVKALKWLSLSFGFYFFSILPYRSFSHQDCDEVLS